MFLFLSKLLPLFFYPLGLLSLLLAGMGFWAWRRRSPLQWPLLLSLLLVFLSGNFWVSQALMRPLEFRLLAPEPLPHAEAVVVLGGSTYPALAPRTFPEVSEAGDRLLRALQLYRAQKAPLIILSGGRIGWMGAGKPEAEDMATLLTWMGVPPQALLLEPNSLNTYENALYVQKILKAQSIGPILLVTSAFHLPRAYLIFKKLGLEVIPAPTDYLTIAPGQERLTWQNLALHLLPDAVNLQVTTLALKEYVGLAVYALRGWL